MAKRMKSKIQPAELKMSFILAPGENYLDISQAASIINRRFYRQGLNWAVSHFTFYKSSAATSAEGILIKKLPESWLMSNGWEKVFRAWNKQQNDVLTEGGQESTKAKFRDFKIFMNEAHFDNGANRNLIPIDSSYSSATGVTTLEGEWEYSQIVIPNFGSPGTNQEAYLCGVGDRNSSRTLFGIIDLYQKSRSVPQSPDPVNPGTLSSDNILSLMFDVGDMNAEVLANATDKNDELPYDQMNYPGGDTQLSALRIHDAGYFTTGDNANKITLEGGQFPCGLINLFNAGDSDVQMILSLVPGNHRGYLAEKMTEM